MPPQAFLAAGKPCKRPCGSLPARSRCAPCAWASSRSRGPNPAGRINVPSIVVRNLLAMCLQILDLGWIWKIFGSGDRSLTPWTIRRPCRDWRPPLAGRGAPSPVSSRGGVKRRCFSEAPVMRHIHPRRLDSPLIEARLLSATLPAGRAPAQGPDRCVSARNAGAHAIWPSVRVEGDSSEGGALTVTKIDRVTAERCEPLRDRGQASRQGREP
jgi:hypothetical protein